MQKNKVIVILGPTASGKSDIAIKIARKFNGEIISADSRQIYKGMDIGSGKVTKEEQKLAPHHMLDIVSPNTEYSVAKFKNKSEQIIKDIISRGKLPIICGGTGFWIKAIVDGVVFPEVKPNPALRNMLHSKTSEDLFEEIKKIDPERAKELDPKNKVRIIRALEICNELGKVPKPKKQKDTPYDFLQIGIKIEKEDLDSNIEKRLISRFREGMIEEIENLHKSGVPWKRMDDFGLEYRWISRYLQKKISPEEMKEKLYFDIIHYAKRQMTWFKKDERIIWLENYEEIERKTETFLKK